MGVRGVDLRVVVGSGVVFHLGPLRSGVRKVEAHGHGNKSKCLGQGLCRVRWMLEQRWRSMNESGCERWIDGI